MADPMTPTPSDAQPVAWLGPYKNDAEALDVLRRAVAEEIGADPETWPGHRNAPLAIAATIALEKARHDAERQNREAAERECEEFRSKLAETIGKLYVADASLAKANARIAEQDRHIERLTAEGLYISEQFSGAAGDIVKLRARIAELERALTKARWYVEAYDTRSKNAEQDRVLTAIEAALTNIEKERDDEA